MPPVKAMLGAVFALGFAGLDPMVGAAKAVKVTAELVASAVQVRTRAVTR